MPKPILDQAKVIELLSSGNSVIQIAKSFNVSRQSVYQFCEKHKITVPKTVLSLKTVKKLIKTGWTQAQIADHYNVPTSSVWYFCKKNNIQPNNPKKRNSNPNCPQCGYPTYRSGDYYRCKDHGNVLLINPSKKRNNNPFCPVCGGDTVVYGRKGSYKCKDCGNKFKTVDRPHSTTITP